jgi:competence protein ComEC
VFVIFAGASASVVRAAIMGILVLIARQSGRTSSIGNVLILTAVGMSLQNPFVLIWDAGFQLSFLSTLGLVYLSPLISPVFKKIPEFFGLKETFISTLSAIGSTLPLILFQFGRLSIVAPVVNILILWIIPWIMIAGAAAVAISFIFLPFGRLIGFVAYVGMSYIIRMVTFFAHLPFASLHMRIPSWLMVLLYVALILGIRKMSIKKSV